MKNWFVKFALILLFPLVIGVFKCEAQIQNGQFVGKVIASDPNHIPNNYLIYTIYAGNTHYSVFGFGKKGTRLRNPDNPNVYLPGDTTGVLYVRNIKGIYNPDGSLRKESFKLTIQVQDKAGARTRAYVTITIIKKRGIVISPPQLLEDDTL